jgi:hypothetical protein
MNKRSPLTRYQRIGSLSEFRRLAQQIKSEVSPSPSSSSQRIAMNLGRVTDSLQSYTRPKS